MSVTTVGAAIATLQLDIASTMASDPRHPGRRGIGTTSPARRYVSRDSRAAYQAPSRWQAPQVAVGDCPQPVPPRTAIFRTSNTRRLSARRPSLPQGHRNSSGRVLAACFRGLNFRSRDPKLTDASDRFSARQTRPKGTLAFDIDVTRCFSLGTVGLLTPHECRN